jgi:hypothetical protein
MAVNAVKTARKEGTSVLGRNRHGVAVVPLHNLAGEGRASVTEMENKGIQRKEKIMGNDS